jgi:hypothetical protein
MASSSATSIYHPDIASIAPNAGALYVQQQTIDVSVDNPASVNFSFLQRDLAGNGPVHLRQSGSDIAYATNQRVPITALQLTPPPGGPLILSPGTQIPAPDFSISGGGGGVSYVSVTCFGDIDWTGGIGVPVPNAGQSAFGTIMVIFNTSFAGHQINIININNGGTLRLPQPSVTLGLFETAVFIYDLFGWMLIARGGSYAISGGNGGDPGSRVITTADNTPTPIASFPDGAAITPGIGIRFDIGAEKNDGLGTTMAWWIGGYAAWDGNNVLQASSKGVATGTNAGAPPVGWDIAFFSAVGGFNGINVIGDNVNTIRWRVKTYTIAAPAP